MAPRPAERRNFEIAIVCALTIEADAVVTLFDEDWDDGDDAERAPYDKAHGDPNAYSAGRIGRHDVVVAHMPGMGKVSAATVAANCRTSWPNIKLALVVGICGAVPFDPQSQNEIILGDVIVSDGVVQYDLGRRLPDRFVRKDTLLDSLGRPNTEIRSLLAKLKGIRDRKRLRAKLSAHLEHLQEEPELKAVYPGIQNDRLFEATYRHLQDGETCEKGGCNGELVSRSRLNQDTPQPQPVVHFGLVASGDTVMKSGEDRDRIAAQEGVIAFEMEGAGLWDTFPCVVIKGACDYSDSHKMKAWQHYAAATAAACAKAFLEYWVPSPQEVRPVTERRKVWCHMPYPRNHLFVPRKAIFATLQQQTLKSTSQVRVSLFGLGGAGKTQLAIEYAYWVQETHSDISVFWVHASNAERFRESYASLARKCSIPKCDEAGVDMLQLVKEWLEDESHGQWLMIIDNADDAELFLPPGSLGKHIPECHHVSILATTRNKEAGVVLSKGRPAVEVSSMDEEESEQLLRANLGTSGVTSDELAELSERLERLPLALAQAAAYIEAQTITVGKYLRLLKSSDQDLVSLLSKDFDTVGRHPETLRAVAETWMLSFEQIQRQNPFAAELLSLMCIFDRQGIAEDFLKAFLTEKGSGRDSLVLSEAVGRLKSFSLIVEAEDETINMHRLVQLVTRNWLQKKGTMSDFGSHALSALSACFPCGNYENWGLCSKYLPHVDAVLKVERHSSKEDMKREATLLNNASRYFFTQGRYEDAESILLKALWLRQEALGANHLDTLAVRNNLAMTFQMRGRGVKAEKLMIEVLEIRKLKLGTDHPDTLINMGNMASIWRQQGRWVKAEEMEMEVLEMRKVKLGVNHSNTLVSMNNLAYTWNKQGRWDEAEKLGAEVLEMRKVKLGVNHPDTLESMNNLACTWYEQGRIEDACVLMQDCISRRQKTLGPHHQLTKGAVETLDYWKTTTSSNLLGGESSR